MTSTIFWENGPGEISVTQFRIAINAGGTTWVILSSNGSTLITDLCEGMIPAVKFLRKNQCATKQISLTDARDDILALRNRSNF